mmetsp:Transcript_3737/g.23509  ORF Transcript_3737/g.23509 Transcript_3737/m.23509 type:complete len:207 (+) Transcript_3737:3404-4024(+)
MLITSLRLYSTMSSLASRPASRLSRTAAALPWPQAAASSTSVGSLRRLRRNRLAVRSSFNPSCACLASAVSSSLLSTDVLAMSLKNMETGSSMVLFPCVVLRDFRRAVRNARCVQLASDPPAVAATRLSRRRRAMDGQLDDVVRAVCFGTCSLVLFATTVTRAPLRRASARSSDPSTSRSSCKAVARGTSDVAGAHARAAGRAIVV